MIYTFQEVNLRGEKRYRCACGKRVRRQKKFWQTLNPYNRINGTPKSYDQIRRELELEIKEWECKADPCTHVQNPPSSKKEE